MLDKPLNEEIKAFKQMSVSSDNSDNVTTSSTSWKAGPNKYNSRNSNQSDQSNHSNSKMFLYLENCINTNYEMITTHTCPVGHNRLNKNKV